MVGGLPDVVVIAVIFPFDQVTVGLAHQLVVANALDFVVVAAL